MACAHCKKIRDAILHGRMAEAAGISVEALREKIGWKSPDEVLATGGPAPTNETAVVGEQSPETIVPAKPKKND